MTPLELCKLKGRYKKFQHSKFTVHVMNELGEPETLSFYLQDLVGLIRDARTNVQLMVNQNQTELATSTVNKILPFLPLIIIEQVSELEKNHAAFS